MAGDALADLGCLVGAVVTALIVGAIAAVCFAAACGWLLLVLSIEEDPYL